MRDRILTLFVAANVTASEAESVVVAVGCRDIASLQDRRALLAPVLSTVEELQMCSGKATSAAFSHVPSQEFEAQSSRERLRSSRDRTEQWKNTEVWQHRGHAQCSRTHMQDAYTSCKLRDDRGLGA